MIGPFKSENSERTAKLEELWLSEFDVGFFKNCVATTGHKAAVPLLRNITPLVLSKAKIQLVFITSFIYETKFVVTIFRRVININHSKLYHYRVGDAKAACFF